MYHVRRKDKEITDPEEIRRILKSTKCVTIALSMDNQPYLVTLSHGYDEARNCIYFHCAKEGKKVDYIKANSRVWGETFIDQGYKHGECNQLYSSVHFMGRVSFVEDLCEKTQAMHCMMKQLESNPEAMIANLKPERFQTALICRIDIEYMSGKKPEETA
jgi:hypothetical protein